MYFFWSWILPMRGERLEVAVGCPGKASRFWPRGSRQLSERVAEMPKIEAAKTKASFIEPMLLLRSERLPEGPGWLYELKLDGYRALAIKAGGKVQLRSRNNNDFSHKFPLVVEALHPLPSESVIDGELVALDASGRPSFNTLQNSKSGSASVFYYVFDDFTIGDIPVGVVVNRWFHLQFDRPEYLAVEHYYALLGERAPYRQYVHNGM